jgi:hypothetical protein
MTPDQHEITEPIREERRSDAAAVRSSERLTLRLRLKSKRKAHALAVASNRSIAQVIEDLIEKCPRDHDS